MAGENNLGFDGAWLKRADGPKASLRRVHRMWPEQTERIRIARGEQGSKARAEIVDGRSFG